MTKRLNNKICIKISNEAQEAVCFLRKNKVNPSNLLRKGGEKELIRVAKEFGKKDTFKYPF